jgi:glycerol-3-phosphate acyltransferase PlsX
MGGDFAPANEVAGAVEAARAYGLEIVLVGRRAQLEAELKHHHTHGLKLDILDAPDVIDMHDSPTDAVRQKPDSSLMRAIHLVKEQRVQALVSAGNTGAVMAAALLELGRIKGVKRPAIAIVIPTLTGRLLLTDIGAQVDCKPEWLVQFGQMGSIYMEHVFGVSNPRVGLLSIGEEESKGNDQVKAAHPLFKQAPLNFAGNVEGKDIPAGLVDVAVCDGFVGNVALKLIEGLATAIGGMMRAELTANPIRKLFALPLRPAFTSLKKQMDWAEYGGAPLLGVDGVCIVAHGRSSPYAIRHAIRVASESASHGVVEQIRSVLGTRQTEQAAGETLNGQAAHATVNGTSAEPSRDRAQPLETAP